jgi:peptide-methionine (S)-S-oxide reductase
MSSFSFFDEPKPITSDSKLGRQLPLETASHHFVSGHSIKPPFAEHLQQAIFCFGCFWGAERKMWQVQGVYSTAVGYIGGHTLNPNYKELCSGYTDHAEAVLVIFDPALISYKDLLKVFWESHNPTQGMRQGADIGSQYRSAIYTQSDEQLSQATISATQYQQALNDNGVVDKMTTEILSTREFFYAEEYHQQYLAKNPEGYCGIKGTGVSCVL